MIICYLLHAKWNLTSWKNQNNHLTPISRCFNMRITSTIFTRCMVRIPIATKQQIPLFFQSSQYTLNPTFMLISHSTVQKTKNKKAKSWKNKTNRSTQSIKKANQSHSMRTNDISSTTVCLRRGRNPTNHNKDSNAQLSQPPSTVLQNPEWNIQDTSLRNEWRYS